MTDIQFSIERNSHIIGTATSAMIDPGEGIMEAVVAEAWSTLATDIMLTISDVTMFAAAWEDPEHWATDWAEKLGIAFEDVPEAVAALLEDAVSG